jgi:hypothetical protein
MSVVSHRGWVKRKRKCLLENSHVTLEAMFFGADRQIFFGPGKIILESRRNCISEGVIRLCHLHTEYSSYPGDFKMTIEILSDELSAKFEETERFCASCGG